MEYKDLLKSHFQYGTKEEDIRKEMHFEKVLENVIVAPWWSHDMFENLGFEVEQVSERVYNFTREDVSFTFLEIKRVGAPAIMEYVLSLGVTPCKNILFLGSAGSLDENIHIGDLVVPEYSICGDGASRYLNDHLEDEFLKKEYPSKDYTEKLIHVLKDQDLSYHFVPNFSIDTVFAQFIHIEEILKTGAKTIEMETANVFKCNELLKKNVTALFCISDNTIVNKSLYSGRSEEENEYRHKVRYEMIPNVVLQLFQNK